MSDDVHLDIIDVNSDGTHWKITNDMSEALDVEFHTASGTRVVMRMPIGGKAEFFPATPEDANLLARKVKGETRLRLIKVR
ncbi:hypothetical protein [Pseudomonas psychrophila]|uniref:hypothetical protein n=1 Tax=Pseudomonas psychrophila TaxID=122355 RepID=UPI00035FD3CD|nr:hypothetical protein [Pseudomonas psychrophila]